MRYRLKMMVCLGGIKGSQVGVRFITSEIPLCSIFNRTRKQYWLRSGREFIHPG